MESIYRHNAALPLNAMESPPFADLSFSGGEGEWLFSPPVKIKNRLGLHARAAARVVKSMEPFNAEIFLVKDGLEVDAKSILALLSLGCPYDTPIRAKALGEDAPQALSTLIDLINNRFGEE